MMAWLPDGLEPWLPWLIPLWLFLLTLWVWRISRSLPRQPVSSRRWNGQSWDEIDWDDGQERVERLGSSGGELRETGLGSGGLGGGSSRHRPGAGGSTDRTDEQTRRHGPDPDPDPDPDAGRRGEQEETIVADFNRLAADFTAEALERFEQRWTPVPAKEVEEGFLAEDEGGAMWFVPTDTGSGRGIVLPGADMVRKWEKFYRGLRGVGAPPGLNASYELVEGPVLRVLAPARGRSGPGGIRVELPGRLAGI